MPVTAQCQGRIGELVSFDSLTRITRYPQRRPHTAFDSSQLAISPGLSAIRKLRIFMALMCATGNCELHEEETHPTYSGRIVSKGEVMRFLAVGPLFAHNPKEARSRLNPVSEPYSFRIRDSFGGTNWRSIPYKQSWKRYWQTSAIPFAF
jgi:hypothetical protein